MSASIDVSPQGCTEHLLPCAPFHTATWQVGHRTARVKLLYCVVLSRALCAASRPFDPTKATPDTGAWCWVGLPKSILINGKGNYYDCEDVYKREVSTMQLLSVRCSSLVFAGSAPKCWCGTVGLAAVYLLCCCSIGKLCLQGVVADFNLKPLVHTLCCATLLYPASNALTCSIQLLMLLSLLHYLPMIQANKTLPYRPSDKLVTAAAKDLMAPNACVAGQLGPTAEQPACDITSKY